MKRSAVLAIVGAAACAAMAGAWFGIKAYAAREAQAQIDAFVERHAKVVRITYEDVDVALPSLATTIRQVRLSAPTLGRIGTIGRVELLEFETRPRNVQAIRIGLKDADLVVPDAGVAAVRAALGSEGSLRGDFEIGLRLEGDALRVSLDADVPKVASAKLRVDLDGFSLGLGDFVKLESLPLAAAALGGANVTAVAAELDDRAWFDAFIVVRAGEGGITPAEYAITAIAGTDRAVKEGVGEVRTRLLRTWQDFLLWRGKLALTAKPAERTSFASLLQLAADAQLAASADRLGLSLVRDGPSGKGAAARAFAGAHRVLDMAMHEALRRGFEDAALRWLSAGADPNAVDPDGRTALVAAVEVHAPRLIGELRKAGASPTAKDGTGLTPLDRARYIHGERGGEVARAFEPEWSAEANRLAEAEKADGAASGSIASPPDLRKGCEAKVVAGMKVKDRGLMRSPDDRRLAFTREVEAPDGADSHVLVHDRKAGSTKVVYSECSGKSLVEPVSLSATTLMVYDHGARQLALIDASGGRTFDRRPIASRPVASPDKTHVAYVDKDRYGASVAVMTAEGTGLKALLGTDMPLLFPVPIQWSPDGSRFAFKVGPSFHWLDSCRTMAPDRRGTCVELWEYDMTFREGMNHPKFTKWDSRLSGLRQFGGVVID